MNVKTLSKKEFLSNYFTFGEFYDNNSSNYMGISSLFFLVSMGEFFPDEYFLSEVKNNKSVFRGVKKEELWEFWRFWAESSRPDLGLMFLKETEILEFFPELYATIGVTQNSETHPEGDVFNHMVFSVREASVISDREELDDFHRYVLMFGVLCHDLGKQITLDKHEFAGIDLAKRFLHSIGSPSHLFIQVPKIVKYHMSDSVFEGKKVDSIDEDFVFRLQEKINPVSVDMLYFVHEADKSGRGQTDLSFEDRTSNKFKKIKAIADANNKEKITYRNIVEWVAEGVLPEDFNIFGEHQFHVIERVNQAIDRGQIPNENVKTSIKNAFNDEYRDSVVLISMLDYRSKKKIVNYLNDNDISLDDLLLKGKFFIEDILNTPIN